MIKTDQDSTKLPTKRFNALIKNIKLKSGFMPSNFNVNTNEASSALFDDKVEEYDWSNYTLLIAEDEETNFIYLESALVKTKINILRARNGVEAVELAKVTPSIDLILMDIKMPEMNGIEATRSIKSFRKDLPIVAQTAFAMDEDRRNCLAVGCDEFLAKPVRYKTLIETLTKFL